MAEVLVVGMPKLHVRMSAAATLHCPGCQHPTIERIVAELLEEMDIWVDTIGVFGVGCGTRFFHSVRVDAVQAAHGRACDVATGVKRGLLGKPFVFTLQGDGDAIAIGAGGLIGAAGRGEKITVIMVNNANYGTTGGQMAPTTLMKQITTTSPYGRDSNAGYPIHVAELLTQLKGVAFSARGSLTSPANYRRTKEYIKIAFEKQLNNVGFSFVEILAACPTNWHMSPVESLKWIDEQMSVEFPLGEYKNVNSID